MTHPVALTQFHALIGGDLIAKGSIYEEPTHGPQAPVAYIIGQCDYIAGVLRSPLGTIGCPFVPNTVDAVEWYRGHLSERMSERIVVKTYASMRNQQHD